MDKVLGGTLGMESEVVLCGGIHRFMALLHVSEASKEKDLKVRDSEV